MVEVILETLNGLMILKLGTAILDLHGFTIGCHFDLYIAI